ncbi:MAG: hypothetical protein JO153_00865 [Solirubrobacterales bacterium]|nr:hypothetical protein [Solirubrobacterales bacterium]MBV9915022.1 hypothetical protein [Solirubrobacterales bacterium]
MFNKDLSPTRSYRSLARGRGAGWARAYQRSQQRAVVGNSREDDRAEPLGGLRRSEAVRTRPSDGAR